MVRPAFIPAAGAQVEGGGFPEDEAGISAYFDAGATINLDDVRDVFGTIDDETSQYIIGAVPLPGYEEWMAVHVFVHVDGWAVAYYRLEDPAAKMMDIRGYNASGEFNTNMETVLTLIANSAGFGLPPVSFYHFQYPNATHFTVVAEHSDATGFNFQIELTSAYAYSERSGAMYITLDNGTFRINDTPIFGCIGHTQCFDFIEPSELPADLLHTVSMTNYVKDIALVLIYRIP